MGVKDVGGELVRSHRVGHRATTTLCGLCVYKPFVCSQRYAVVGSLRLPVISDKLVTTCPHDRTFAQRSTPTLSGQTAMSRPGFLWARAPSTEGNHGLSQATSD
jgi:hypothetical protein